MTESSSPSDVRVHGLAIAGFRSFGDDVQYIAPCRKINLLVGPNNAGKSNVLEFLKKHIQLLNPRESSSQWDKNLDPHIGGTKDCIFGIATDPDDPRIDELRRKVSSGRINYLTTALGSVMHHSGFWTYRQLDPSKNQFRSPTFHSENFDVPISLDCAQRLASDLAHPGKIDQISTFVNLLFSKFTPFQTLVPPEISFIPAVRNITKGDAATNDWSGLGLIERLAKHRDPGHLNQKLRSDFESIERFLQQVTGDTNAKLEIPHDRTTLEVNMNRRLLPLESLGTGIHEVVILAAASTIVKDQIVCIEEPEIHLHPVLQRKLIQYLSDNTANQYFITTHSAHLMDCDEATLFGLSLKDGQTVVRRLTKSSDKWVVCRDLGYRASDIAQANCILWVEGPSDRVYLNHWITAVASDLVEGVHYQVMFYGGRLLSQLSAQDPEVTEFISLCALNRNIAIVIDSDKKQSKDRPNATKQRVKKETHESNGFVWITKCREIENYVTRDTLVKAVDDVKRGRGRLVPKDLNTNEFVQALPKVTDSPGAKAVDKVKVAHRVTEQQAVLDQFDLQRQIDKLVQFIRQCND